MRLLGLLLTVSSVACFGAGFYSYLQDRSDEELALTVHEPERDLGTIPVGQEYAVEFIIANRSGRDWRIVGVPPS